MTQPDDGPYALFSSDAHLPHDQDDGPEWRAFYERGTLTEILDDRWSFTDDPIVYVYHVTIRPGQLRGWVVHRIQNDRLFAYAGVLKIVLYDARVDSSARASCGRTA